ncbi:MAG TPA: aldolase/citrate lyase family protein [Vicinamibacterales bacterium]|jgi:4-hydroxy-2-oxoheptanedioate aldolase|nr:aldolase/citrate lyase family protein [Vicinamibacterales bacterium]
MPDTPRLNSIIRLLEQQQIPITVFSPPAIESAIELATAKYDGVVFEAEHNPYDIRGLRDCLQYMLNRRQLFERQSLSPAVTPIIRIPANGGEMNQWMAKQALDIGAYGIVWPRVSTVEQAYNAVASCRYPRPQTAAAYEPAGLRGDQPVHAARYWGITPQEYYAKADVWPLAPHGEILVIVMCEDVDAVDNLPRILKEVKGIGVVLIGEGDLSQNLGYPRQYDHPAVVEAMTAIRRICGEHGVVCGHPHVETQNAQRVIDEGYRFLMAAPARTFAGLDACRTITGRT